MIRAAAWPTFVTALLLTAMLSSCLSPRSWLERDAPELGKTYVLTEDAVLTRYTLLLPGLFQSERAVWQIMTPGYFKHLNDNYPEFPPLPDRGRVKKGARLTVDQVFLYSDFNASVRYSRGQISDPGRGEYRVYVIFEDSADTASILQEVK